MAKRRNTAATRKAATAKKAPAKGRGKSGSGPKGITELRVKFGRVSIGENDIAITTNIDRSEMSLAKVDNMFCGQRIRGSAIALTADVDPDQKVLPNMDDMDMPRCDNTFDVGSVSAKPAVFSIRLKLPKDEGDLNSLACFPNRLGVLRIESSEPIPRREKKGKTTTAEPATVT